MTPRMAISRPPYRGDFTGDVDYDSIPDNDTGSQAPPPPSVKYCGFKIANCKEDKCQFWAINQYGADCIWVLAGRAIVEIAFTLESQKR